MNVKSREHSVRVGLDAGCHSQVSVRLIAKPRASLQIARKQSEAVGSLRGSLGSACASRDIYICFYMFYVHLTGCFARPALRPLQTALQLCTPYNSDRQPASAHHHYVAAQLPAGIAT